MSTPFSAIYAFFHGASGKQIAKLETLQLSKEIKDAIKAKVYLVCSQNYLEGRIAYRLQDRVPEPYGDRGADMRTFSAVGWLGFRLMPMEDQFRPLYQLSELGPSSRGRD